MELYTLMALETRMTQIKLCCLLSEDLTPMNLFQYPSEHIAQNYVLYH